MGASITTIPQSYRDGRWIDHIDGPFQDKCYHIFAFLADVRNDFGITPTSPPRGFPSDASQYVRDKFWDGHDSSWLTIDELVRFDYDQTIQLSNGEITTYHEFLGPWFFTELQALVDSGATRLVFWFIS